MSEAEKPKPDVPPPRRTNVGKHIAGENLLGASLSISQKDSDVPEFPNPSQDERFKVKKSKAEPQASTISPIFPETINPFTTLNPNTSDLPFRNESYFGTVSLEASPSAAPIADIGFTFLSDASPTPLSMQPILARGLPFSPRPLTSTTASSPTRAASAPSTQAIFPSSFYDDICLSTPIGGESSSAPPSQTTFNLPLQQKENSPASISKVGAENPPSATNITFFSDASPVSPTTERIKQHVTGLGGIFAKAAHPTSIPIAGHVSESSDAEIMEDKAVAHATLFNRFEGLEMKPYAVSGDSTPTPKAYSQPPLSTSIFGSIDAEGNSKDLPTAYSRPGLSRGELFTADPPISAVNPRTGLSNEFASSEEASTITISISTTAQGTSISIRIPGKERIEIERGT